MVLKRQSFTYRNIIVWGLDTIWYSWSPRAEATMYPQSNLPHAFKFNISGHSYSRNNSREAAEDCRVASRGLNSACQLQKLWREHLPGTSTRHLFRSSRSFTLMPSYVMALEPQQWNCVTFLWPVFREFNSNLRRICLCRFCLHSDAMASLGTVRYFAGFIRLHYSMQHHGTICWEAVEV